MSDPEVRSAGEARAAAGLEPSGAAPYREAIATEERTQLQMVVRRFLRHRLAVISLIGLLLIVTFFGNDLKEMFFSSSNSLRSGKQQKVNYDSKQADVEFSKGNDNHGTADMDK
jgi:hypothetical protein